METSELLEALDYQIANLDNAGDQSSGAEAVAIRAAVIALEAVRSAVTIGHVGPIDTLKVIPAIRDELRQLQ